VGQVGGGLRLWLDHPAVRGWAVPSSVTFVSLVEKRGRGPFPPVRMGNPVRRRPRGGGHAPAWTPVREQSRCAASEERG